MSRCLCPMPCTQSASSQPTAACAVKGAHAIGAAALQNLCILPFNSCLIALSDVARSGQSASASVEGKGKGGSSVLDGRGHAATKYQVADIFSASPECLSVY